MQIFEESQARCAIWQDASARLDRVVATLGLASSRSRAAELIAAGAVQVAGQTVTKPGVRISAGQEVCVTASEKYVSAGALKLLAALDAFGIAAAGKVALDVGASTGGFTQVLLERGVRKVLAIDVGHDQLSPLLRDREEVLLAEGVNARDLTPELLARVTGTTEVPQLVVGDLSFISLTLLFAVFRDVATVDADFVLLVKPQFEQGKAHRGVVTDPRLWEAALERVLTAAGAAGLRVAGLIVSPVRGGEGNREFLVHLRRGEANQGEWMQWVSAVCSEGEQGE